MGALAQTTPRTLSVRAAAAAKWLVAGVIACSGTGSTEPALPPPPPAQGGTPPPAATSSVASVSGTAAVVRYGDKVWLWVDGRGNALSVAVDQVRWSAQGFELPDGNGFTKVLSPGGAVYHRSPDGPSRTSVPLSDLLGKASTPPAGFAITFTPGIGNTRVQAVLTGPSGQRVRLGLFDHEPDEMIWLEGTVEEGATAAPPIAGSAAFSRDAAGNLTLTPPPGAEAVDAASADDGALAHHLAVLQTLSKDGSPLTLGFAVTTDLDHDHTSETVVCLEGNIGMLDPRCILIDEVEQQQRYYSVGLPYRSGDPPPLVFRWNESQYLMMVSPDDRRTGYILRSDGRGWVTEPIPTP